MDLGVQTLVKPRRLDSLTTILMYLGMRPLQKAHFNLVMFQESCTQDA